MVTAKTAQPKRRLKEMLKSYIKKVTAANKK